ncbi:MAG: ribulose-phosphate 3-epimerase [Acidimicrobiales bacterium]
MARPRPFVSPSILSADFAELARDIASVRDEAGSLHVDVMDGHFVPNLTIGPLVVASIRRHTSLFLDCHLMMTNPAKYVEAFRRAGADGCTIHAELDDTEALIVQMRELGLAVGLAVNPDGPFALVQPYLDKIDLLLCMTVFPGFGGQAFMPDVMDKVTQARAEIDRRGLDVAIQVDGGIDERTAVVAAAAGADVFVAGSAVFGADVEGGPAQAVARIRTAAESGMDQ